MANAAALGPRIEELADQIATDRRLPDDLIEDLRAAGVFRIAFPLAWGGPEMDIITEFALEHIAFTVDAWRPMPAR